MALLLDMSPRFLERALYFSHWIVTRADQGKIAKNVERIRDAVNDELQEIDNSRELERKRALDEYAEAQTRLAEEDESITKEDVEQMRKRAEDASGDSSPKSARKSCRIRSAC
jgi:t-SNARE complex subunit (syntaxin)